MYDVQVNITHTAWIRCANGTTIPNDILRSVQDFAEMVNGDIVAEFTTRSQRYGVDRFHYDYDNEVWHDPEHYELCEDGEWREDLDWSWPDHLVDDSHMDDGTDSVPAAILAKDDLIAACKRVLRHSWPDCDPDAMRDLESLRLMIEDA